MGIDIIWLIIGLGAILIGANMLTDGASAIALRAGISDLTVGLTVVAFGTSAPELVISMLAACDGAAPLAVGNVVGSNIFNILAIIGVTAIARPIKISRSVLTSEIPMVILSSLVLLVLGNSAILDGTASGENQISRVSGIFLLVFFALFMRYTMANAKRGAEENTEEGKGKKKTMGVWKACLRVITGLVGLIWGGDRFVDGACGIAAGLGVSEATIGLTIVAAGTSLPELATSVVAAIKGKPGLAVGNVIGSCIFNVFMVLGVSSVITPLTFGNIGNIDLLTLLGASVLFYVFGWLIGNRTITRGEGAVMTGCYLGYLGMLLYGL